MSLAKTELFGVDGRVLDWLKSYLSGRSSYVSLGAYRSQTIDCSTGVPQGSVLGPLLFSIFTTPVGHLISTFGVSYHQYADDTQLYTTIDPSSDNDLRKLSDCVEAVTTWHLQNGLLLNSSKTEGLVAGTRQQVAKFNCSAGISLADTTVRCSTAVRVLGVTIDQHLTFDDHITRAVSTCNYHIRSLRHIRRLIDRETANVLACSIVATRLDYCNALLYGITAKNIRRLQRVQNSLARVVCGVPYRSHSVPLLRSLHWLPVRQRIQYKIAVLTFKARHLGQPTYLHDLINEYRPSRQLRSSDTNLLAIPRTTTNTAARAFSSAAPRIWNSLPADIRTVSSISSFTRLLKTHLFNTALG